MRIKVRPECTKPMDFTRTIKKAVPYQFCSLPRRSISARSVSASAPATCSVSAVTVRSRSLVPFWRVELSRQDAQVAHGRRLFVPQDGQALVTGAGDQDALPLGEQSRDKAGDGVCLARAGRPPHHDPGLLLQASQHTTLLLVGLAGEEGIVAEQRRMPQALSVPGGTLGRVEVHHHLGEAERRVRLRHHGVRDLTVHAQQGIQLPGPQHQGRGVGQPCSGLRGPRWLPARAEGDVLLGSPLLPLRQRLQGIGMQRVRRPSGDLPRQAAGHFAEDDLIHSTAQWREARARRCCTSSR